MNIGIIGSGAVAKALGAGFMKHGYGVMLGTRDRAKLADWVSKNAGAKVGSFAEAAAFGDERSAELFHERERLAHGATAGGVPEVTLREGVQFRWQCEDGEPAVRRWTHAFKVLH